MKKANFMFLVIAAMALMLSAGGVSLGCAADIAAPKDYPKKDIYVIVPFPAGGGTDITARGFLKVAEKYIKAKFLVTNVSGSGGWAGWHQSLAAKHDGYNLSLLTINMFTSSGTANHWKHFTPLATLSRYPTTISVPASSDIRTLADLIKKAKEKPGGIRFGNDGLGALDHIYAQKFMEMAGIKVSFVPYRGGGETIAAAIGGNIDALTCNTPEVAGRDDIRILALMADERMPKMPGVPTMKELGYDIVVTRFRTMGIQADAPKAVIDYLESVFAKTARDPEWLKYAESVNAEPYYLNRADSITYFDHMAALLTPPKK